MLTFLPIRAISLALSFLLLTGCAEFTAGWNGDSGRYNDPYVQSDFDELLAFGANMANTPPSSRTKVCRTLLKRQRNSPGTGVQLHLLVGRLLSDSCGEISEILDSVAAITPGSLRDDRMQKLVAIHTEALKRMNNVPRKIITQECKQKAIRSVPKSKEPTKSTYKSTDKSTDNETRLLREKLDAIRSMEKHLDETGGAN